MAHYGEGAGILAQEENEGAEEKGQGEARSRNLPGISAFQEGIGSDKYRCRLG